MSALAQMPATAAFLAEVGRAFGRDAVVGAVRAALEADADTFYACENGLEVGRRAREGLSVSARDMELIVAPPPGNEKGRAR